MKFFEVYSLLHVWLLFNACSICFTETILESCYFAKNQPFYRNNELIEPFVLVSDVNEMLYSNFAIKSQRSPSCT